MGKVQVWASQLWANDFPPVCAMTGRPAETWKKFKFATAPDWTYALLILICLGGLGFIAFAIVVALVSQRASGYLPLTRSSSRTVTLAFWIPLVLLIAWPVSWLIAAIFGFSSNDPTASTIAGVSFWLGVLFLVAGLIGRLVVTLATCIRSSWQGCCGGSKRTRCSPLHSRHTGPDRLKLKSCPPPSV